MNFGDYEPKKDNLIPYIQVQSGDEIITYAFIAGTWMEIELKEENSEIEEFRTKLEKEWK